MEGLLGISNMLIVDVHYTHQCVLCNVTIVDFIHVHLVVHYKIVRTYHTLLLLLAEPM